MNDSIYRINLDIHTVGSQVFLPVKRGDTARTILIRLTEGYKSYQIADGCSARFCGKKPDGNYLYNDCTISGGIITYDLTSQTTACEGVVECEIQLFDADEKQITSPRFSLVVDGTVYNGEEIASTPEADALKELTDRAEEIVNQYDEGIIVGKGYVDNNFANALKGSASGKVVAIKDVSPIEHNVDVKLQINESPAESLAAEDGDVCELSKAATKVTITGNVGNLSDNNHIYIIPILEDGTEVVEAKVEVHDGNGETSFDIELTYTIVDTVLSWVCKYTATLNPDNPWTESGTATVATGAKIGSFRNSGAYAEYVITVANESSVEVKVYGKNLFDEQVEIGGINASTGANADGVTNCLRTKNFIKVLPSTTYFVSCPAGLTSAGGLIQVYRYDANKNFLGYGSTGIENAALKTQANWHYIRCVIRKEYGTTYKNDIQLELGSTATEYEPYIEPTIHTITTDGTAFESVYPSMTFIPEKDGVELSVEYNRDINKAFAELQQVIAQLQTLAVATVPMNEEV